MTVKELIEQLSKVDPEATVAVKAINAPEGVEAFSDELVIVNSHKTVAAFQWTSPEQKGSDGFIVAHPMTDEDALAKMKLSQLMALKLQYDQSGD